MRYVVFDTETPNRCNDRISQIGFCVVEDGIMGPERCFLVNPECSFDEFNIMLTGIRPEQCRCEPDFAELWSRELEEVFSEGVLVAHNAPFDMAVLAKCLRAYGTATNCAILASGELTGLAADIKLGACLGYIPIDGVAAIDEIVTRMRPYNINKSAGRNLSASERDVYRAEYVGEHIRRLAQKKI